MLASAQCLKTQDQAFDVLIVGLQSIEMFPPLSPGSIGCMDNALLYCSTLYDNGET